ncbi:MAG: ABC transporter permease [Candidatus Hydrogenedentes bacterium]|nr:ABC transporter permease [Candidatus Hydrogenedentota bacterium]
MKAYIIRRLLLIVPTFVGISLISFCVIQLAPGSPVSFKLLGMQGSMQADANTQKIIEDTTRAYGLDKPIPEQYVLWLGRLVRLDFGTSFKDQRPVRDKLFEALPITIELNVISIFLIYILSIPLGIYSSTHTRSVSDNVLTVILFVLYSLPSFFVAMLLILYLGGGEYLDWFPVYGTSSLAAESWPWWKRLADHVWHIALPVFCLTYGGLAGLSRYARAGMIETIRQDYIRTARAYGFSERVVVLRYALRNSLIPILTLLGTLLPAMIGGSVIIERIFSIPGMGRLTFDAILARDYTTVMGALAMSAFLTLIGLLVTDVLYAVVDPRIKYD